MKRQAPRPCTCSAYPFPHRPGSGRCEFLTAQERMAEMYGYNLTMQEYVDYDQEDAAATVHEIAVTYELAPTPRYWQIQYADLH